MSHGSHEVWLAWPGVLRWSHSWQLSPPFWPRPLLSSVLALISSWRLRTSASHHCTSSSKHFATLKWARLEVLDNLEAAARPSNERSQASCGPMREAELEVAARPGGLWRQSGQQVLSSVRERSVRGEEWGGRRRPGQLPAEVRTELELFFIWFQYKNCSKFKRKW